MTLWLRGATPNVRADSLSVRAITNQATCMISEIKNQGGKKMRTSFEYGKTLAGQKRKRRRNSE